MMHVTIIKKLQPYYSRIFLLAFLLVLVLVLNALSPYFLTWDNMRNILDQSAIFMILAVGMTFVICSGGIDLSIGAIMAMTGVVAAMSMAAGLPVAVAIIFALLTAIIIGIANGIFISVLKMNPFIVTLSMMSIIRGSAILMTNSRPIYGFAEGYSFIGSGPIGAINFPILMALIIVVVGIVLLGKTKFGNYCYVFGTNETALKRTGVNTNRYKISIYVLSAICAGIVGLIVSSKLDTAEPLAGVGYEMDAIAAVVLGGTSMSGGKGSVSGTFIACLVLNVMRNGLSILTISANYQLLLTGAIVLIAVLVTESRKRMKQGE